MTVERNGMSGVVVTVTVIAKVAVVVVVVETPVGDVSQTGRTEPQTLRGSVR